MDSEQRHAGAAGFFDIDGRLKRLSDLGDQLETVRLAVDFELFPAGIKCGAQLHGPEGRAAATVRPSADVGKALQAVGDAIRMSPMPRFFSSFMTRSQNLAPSVCSIEMPSISFVPSGRMPSAM